MPRAPQKPVQSSSAVNVVCVDVNALLRAAREKEQRERVLLDDRPVLGKTIDDILEEEMRLNKNTTHNQPHDDGDDEEIATPADPKKPAGGTVDGYLIKGCPRDAMVFPPLSPADATILQEVLRNPEVTLAKGEHLTSRPSWTVRDEVLSASSRSTRQERPVSSASSVSSATRESFHVVPHIEDRFRAQRRSRVDLEPYTTNTHHRHSTRSSAAECGRDSLTQMFLDEDAQRRRASHTLRGSLREAGAYCQPDPQGMPHSDSHRAPSLSPPFTTAGTPPPSGTSFSSSTVDCLVLDDTATVSAPRVSSADLRRHAPEKTDAWRHAQTGDTAEMFYPVGGGGAALAKLYLRSGVGGAGGVAPRTLSTMPTVAGESASGNHNATAPSSRRTANDTGGVAMATSKRWEALPSLAPRTHTAAFCSTLHTANAVRVREADRYHQQVRKRQLTSKPPRSSSCAQTAASTRTTSGRSVPVAFRHAAAVAESQPKTRRPKRQ